MGWLPQSKFDEIKAKALALTSEQREALTWDEARKLMPHDTICMAKFQGAMNNGATPWQAVVFCNCITKEELGNQRSL